MELLGVSESRRVTLRARYLPATDHKGQRISVFSYESSTNGIDPQRVIFSWDYSLDLVPNYVAAVEEYLRRTNWGGQWVVSMITDGAVAVCLDAVAVGA